MKQVLLLGFSFIGLTKQCAHMCLNNLVIIVRRSISQIMNKSRVYVIPFENGLSVMRPVLQVNALSLPPSL